MHRQTLNHFFMTKGISLIVIVEVLALSSLTGMAGVSGNSQRKDVIQGHEELGQIIIEGEVTRVQGEFVGKEFSHMKDKRYIVETPFGRKWDLYLGKNTQIIGDIFLGDQVKVKIDRDGVLQMVQKIEQKYGIPQQSMVRHGIAGIVERKDTDFLFVTQGDHSETLPFDKQNVEGAMRERSNSAEEGDLGYAIQIPVFQNEPEEASH